jgi:2,3-bisphosphoglycerate-independent phosphoglycerate mutase
MRGRDRRILWIVLDGMADRPADELDGLTALEAAETPQLDRLAAAGTNGTMDVAAPGTPLSSDRAHAILFGYDRTEVPGRGVLEARGFGVDVPPGTVACSASFARAERQESGWTVVDRHLRGADHDYAALADRVSSFATGDVRASFIYTWKNRGLVRLSADDPLSASVTDVDPFETGRPVVRPEPLDASGDAVAARRTADALAAYTRHSLDRLAGSSVDVVLSKWAATPGAPTPFRERHGLDACSLTDKPVLRGLARTLGLEQRAPAPDFDSRAGDVLDAVADHEFVHAHYPEPDEVAHAEGPVEKRTELEAVDASLEPVVDRAVGAGDLVTVVTADHTTPSTEDVVHSGAPVPVTVTGEPVRSDGVTAAGERPAARGGLGRIRGRDLLRLSRAAADRVLLDGLRRTAANRDHPHGTLTPLGREDSGN